MKSLNVCGRGKLFYLQTAINITNDKNNGIRTFILEGLKRRSAKEAEQALFNKQI